jgi:hypothetical protein
MDLVRSRSFALNLDVARAGVKTGPYGGNGGFRPRHAGKRQHHKIVRLMKVVGSRNVALDFDLARAGVKTGPYGGNAQRSSLVEGA